jgi:hypothetical protein
MQKRREGVAIEFIGVKACSAWFFICGVSTVKCGFAQYLVGGNAILVLFFAGESNE